MVFATCLKQIEFRWCGIVFTKEQAHFEIYCPIDSLWTHYCPIDSLWTHIKNIQSLRYITVAKSKISKRTEYDQYLYNKFVLFRWHNYSLDSEELETCLLRYNHNDKKRADRNKILLRDAPNDIFAFKLSAPHHFRPGATLTPSNPQLMLSASESHCPEPAQ